MISNCTNLTARSFLLAGLVTAIVAVTSAPAHGQIAAFAVRPEQRQAFVEATFVFTGRPTESAFIQMDNFCDFTPALDPGVYPLQEVVRIRPHERAELVQLVFLGDEIFGPASEPIQPGTRFRFVDICGAAIVVDVGNGPETWVLMHGFPD
jgi:hypothetical protein